MTRRLIRDPRLPVVWAMLVCFWSAAPIVRAQDCRNAYAPWAASYHAAARARDLVVDHNGAVISVGSYSQTIAGPVDFDPTEGVDERTAVGSSDAFVTKLNADGSYAWTYTAGGPDLVLPRGVAAGSDGTIWVSGGFAGSADFDAAGAGDVRTAVGDFNGFIVKLSDTGQYLSTITFGEGTHAVSPSAIEVDPYGNIVVVGSFGGTADFDPGLSSDLHTATPLAQLVGSDIFVTKVLADGSYGWTNTTGAPGADGALLVDTDAKGNIYVAGTFRGTVDFDPGLGEDFHTVMGEIEDTFITKFYPDGTYAWTRTYPTRPPDSISGIMTVDDDGNVYLSGGFGDTMDFDPTEGVDVHKSIGTGAMFVTKLHSDGSYGGTWTAGGAAGGVGGRGVAVDSTGNVYATGSFNGIVDFDPGPGFDVHLSRGADDVFITQLGTDGSYRWTHTFGSIGSQHASHVTVDRNGDVVTQGFVKNFIDGRVEFDPSCQVLERVLPEEEPGGPYVSKIACFAPSADFDGDGYVNLRDLAAYQNCFTGPRRRIPTDCLDGCATFDFVPDNTINRLDLPDIAGSLEGP